MKGRILTMTVHGIEVSYFDYPSEHIDYFKDYLDWFIREGNDVRWAFSAQGECIYEKEKEQKR